MLVTGFPLIPFDLLTALIFLLVSLTSHSLKMLRKGGKIVVALRAVNAVIDGNETDAVLWENHFADLDKTTKNLCGAADNKFKYAMEQKAISIIVADCFFVV